MTGHRITTKLTTVALTEAMAFAWKLIYGGSAVAESWASDQTAIESRPVKHWCVQRLLSLSDRVVRAGEALESLVDRAAGRLGIDMLDVLTSRVDPRLA